MVTQAQRSRGIRLAAIAISCTALVGAAIGPALASSRSAATSATHSGADLVRIQHLEAETAGAEPVELDELNGLIDPTDATGADPAESDPPEAADPPAREQDGETDHAPKVEPTAHDQQAHQNDQADENDQGEQQDGEHDGADSGEHDGADSGDGTDATPETDPVATDGGDSGGD